MQRAVPEWAGPLWDVVFSLNRLVERDKGTAPLLAFYYPADGRREDPPLADYHGCRQVLDDLLARVGDLDLPEHRRRFLVEVCRALRVQTEEGMGQPIAYGERIRAYLGVPGEPVPAATVTKLQEDLEDALAMAGIRGSVVSAMERWRESSRIPADALRATGEALLAEAQRTTHEKVVPLPPEAQMTFEPVHDVYYRGYSHALGDYAGKITVNADLPWTRAELTSLLAHEGCPGHFALSAVRRKHAAEGRLPAECAFYFANTPITPVVEGTCNLGSYLLGWFSGVDDLVTWRYELLRAALIANLCFMGHEALADDEALVDYFRSEGGGGEAAARQAVRFVRHPLWCTSIPHYFHGTVQAFSLYKRALKADALSGLVDALFGRVHTYGTLGDVRFSPSEGPRT